MWDTFLFVSLYRKEKEQQQNSDERRMDFVVFVVK